MRSTRYGLIVCYTTTKVPLQDCTPDETVPKEYKDFAKLFKRRSETELLAYTKYDHEIPLKEGKKPMFKPIFPINLV